MRSVSFTRRSMLGFCMPVLLVVGACDSQIVSEAKQAEKDGRVISNEMMQQMYPRSFQKGSPAYLERDFEAGADFICNQIRIEHERDICAEPEINWY